MNIIQQHLEEAQKVLSAFLGDKNNIEAIATAGDFLVEAFNAGNKVMSCGNGGSMCDAMHFAEELTGRFRENRKPLPAISISDSSHLSCVSNDYGYDEVFSRYIDALGKTGDVLLAISTSGNSPNVLKACEVAKKNGIKIIALTGKDGGKLKDYADVEIRAPHNGYADRIQEIHIKVIHCLIDYVERNISNL